MRIMEVEHDFLKTPVPRVILKFIWQRPNFTEFYTHKTFDVHKCVPNLYIFGI